jgi:hypothetical protein
LLINAHNGRTIEESTAHDPLLYNFINPQTGDMENNFWEIYNRQFRSRRDDFDEEPTPAPGTAAAGAAATDAKDKAGAGGKDSAGKDKAGATKDAKGGKAKK